MPIVDGLVKSIPGGLASGAGDRFSVHRSLLVLSSHQNHHPQRSHHSNDFRHKDLASPAPPSSCHRAKCGAFPPSPCSTSGWYTFETQAVDRAASTALAPSLAIEQEGATWKHPSQPSPQTSSTHTRCVCVWHEALMRGEDHGWPFA